MKFRKKPVVIEAIQFRRAEHFDGKRVTLEGIETSLRGSEREFFVLTLEGTMAIREGDWLITGVRGERYPCRSDIFAETYEPVAEAPGASPRAALCRCGHVEVMHRVYAHPMTGGRPCEEAMCVCWSWDPRGLAECSR